MRYTVLYLKSLDGFKIVAVSLAAMLDTVKHGYGKHAYNELTLRAEWFSLPMTL